MSSDISSWCKDGQHCARGKASAQPAAPIQPITVPERRFTHVHVDIGDPLPTSAEVSPHQSISAQKCMDTFISTWVARYGVLARTSPDQGQQFTSAMWTGLHKMLGVQLINNTAYHPQSNGMLERCHGQMKAALRADLLARCGQTIFHGYFFA